MVQQLRNVFLSAEAGFQPLVQQKFSIDVELKVEEVLEADTRFHVR